MTNPTISSTPAHPRCADCGTVPTPGGPAHLWSLEVSDGLRRRTCPPCTRAALGRIERSADPVRQASSIST